LTILIAGPVADAIIWGPSQTLSYYRAWAHESISIGSSGGLIRTQREMDYRNQATAAVAARWLHSASYTRKWDNDPRLTSNEEPAYFNAVNLPRQRIATLVTAIQILLLGTLIWIARRPAQRLTAWRLRAEWALFVLAMLWFMPVMRRYHWIWALPAISMLGYAIDVFGPRSRIGAVAIASVALFFAAQWSILHPMTEAMGFVWISLILLALPLIIALRQRAEPAIAPESPR
jgi:hypothetical protein